MTSKITQHVDDIPPGDRKFFMERTADSAFEGNCFAALVGVCEHPLLGRSVSAFTNERLDALIADIIHEHGEQAAARSVVFVPDVVEVEFIRYGTPPRAHRIERGDGRSVKLFRVPPTVIEAGQRYLAEHKNEYNS